MVEQRLDRTGQRRAASAAEREKILPARGHIRLQPRAQPLVDELDGARGIQHGHAALEPLARGESRHRRFS